MSAQDHLSPEQFILPDGRTLHDAVGNLKKQGMTRLLPHPGTRAGEENLSEHAHNFHQSVSRGEQPTIGETLAGYYVHANAKIDDDYVADKDANIPERHFSARRAAVNHVVFQPKRSNA